MLLLFRWMHVFLGFFFRAPLAWCGAVALAAGLASLPAASLAQAPAFEPAVVVGTPPAYSAQSAVTGTTIDAQGYVYVTGNFYGTVQFGAFTRTSAVTQAFVAKLDGAGNFQWIRTVDGSSFSSGSGVAVDATGRVTVVDSFYAATATFGPFRLANAAPTLNTSHVYVAQLDAAGTWTQAGGPSYDAATAVATPPAACT